MRMEYLYTYTLKFKDSTQELKYCQLREDMFRSNMLCVFLVWVFIVLCQSIIIPRCTVLVICLAVSTVILTVGCMLVMAEEFTGLPLFLQRSSATLVHHRDRRTMFICTVIFLMSAASSIGLWLCPMEIKQNVENSTMVLNPYRSNHTYDSGFRQSLHISAIVRRSFDMNDDSKVLNFSKSQKFMSTDLNNIQDEQLEKSLNKTTLKNEQEEHLYSIQDNENDTSDFNSNVNQYLNEHSEPCSHPEYLVFTWVLCLIALATGLKLYYLVKTFMASIMVCCYAVLISIVFPEVFENASTESEENSKYGMPLTARMNILLIVFLTMVTYHARLVEVTSRLDFIWKEQAEKELSNMKSNRILNDLLIKVRISYYILFNIFNLNITYIIVSFLKQNILPDHVASYYLSDGRSDELYAKMHNLCGVMFASIPNFQDFYSEDIENGKACIRILNEIICDFDSLMDEPRFSTVEKIKTVGATYMAVYLYLFISN